MRLSYMNSSTNSLALVFEWNETPQSKPVIPFISQIMQNVAGYAVLIKLVSGNIPCKQGI